MAIYTYRCVGCDAKAEVVQSIKAYCEAPNVPVCADCGGEPMERYLTAPLITFDQQPWDAFVSPIDGTLIDSRSKRNEHMVAHGVVPFEEIKPDFQRNRERIQKEQKEKLKADIVEGIQRAEAGAFEKPAVAEEGYDPITPADVTN